MAVTEKEFKKLAGRIVDMEKNFKKMDEAIKANAAGVVRLVKLDADVFRVAKANYKDFQKLEHRVTRLEKRK